MRELLKNAFSVLKDNKVSYGDVRYRTTDYQQIYTMNEVLKDFTTDSDSGVGVRVLKNGRWGFASTPYLTEEALVRTAQKAVKIAESTGEIKQKPIILTADLPAVAKFKSKMEIDPFKVPLGEKVAILRRISQEANKIPLIKRTDAFMFFRKFQQILLTTEGADLENEICTSIAWYQVTAVDRGDFQSRMYQEKPKTCGYEWILEQPLVERARFIAEEAVQKLRAPRGPVGHKDIILMPSNLVLTIHESVGHPTELDRVLGWEANFAGTSFATLEKLNSFAYGSPIVNFRADNNMTNGGATWGFDDDGIPSKSWDIIKDGILVGHSTTRDTAHYIGQNASMGCSRADSYKSFPINRIPNLNLLPGKSSLSLDDLMADTKDGLLFDGRSSYSIDQRRYNFQFGGDFVQEIKNGKITGPLRDVTYQSISSKFWNSCDAICDRRYFDHYGVWTCGKGEPIQGQQMSHGSAPARFKNIFVGGALNG